MSPLDCTQTSFCPRMFVPRYVCAQTRLCPDAFVPRHVCAQTRLCPDTFVPRHVCALTHFVPRLVCSKTSLYYDNYDLWNDEVRCESSFAYIFNICSTLIFLTGDRFNIRFIFVFYVICWYMVINGTDRGVACSLAAHIYF